MGFGIVDIWKVAEDRSSVEYAFDHEGKSGRFSIDRETGQIVKRSFAVGDPEERAGLAAQHKIIKAWREGELPARTQWAG